MSASQLFCFDLEIRQVNDHAVLRVLYNEYATRADALAAIESLPEALRRNHPFPRTIGGLRERAEG